MRLQGLNVGKHRRVCASVYLCCACIPVHVQMQGALIVHVLVHVRFVCAFVLSCMWASG